MRLAPLDFKRSTAACTSPGVLELKDLMRTIYVTIQDEFKHRMVKGSHGGHRSVISYTFDKKHQEHVRTVEVPSLSVGARSSPSCNVRILESGEPGVTNTNKT